MLKTIILVVTALLLTGCDIGRLTAKTAQVSEVIAVDTEHTSRNALDWAGLYQGVLPCADCEGIRINLILNQDESYRMETEYLGKKGKVWLQSGRFNWQSNGSVIELQPEEEGGNGQRFFVAENAVRYLDQQGKEIQGELAAHYHLQKKYE